MHDHGLVTASFSYAAAFMTGILGSGHCLGMCGSLVCGYFLKNSPGRSALPYLAYHGARLGVYAAIGVVAAAAGAVLVQTGRTGEAQGLLQIVAGIVVVLLGVELVGVLPFSLTVHFAPARWLASLFARAGRWGAARGAALAGAVNGLMPCPMTMAIAVTATTAPTVPEGAAIMLALGAGTLPAMLFASVLFGRLGPRLRGALQKVAALFVIALGAATLWQGIAYYRVMHKLAG